MAGIRGLPLKETDGLTIAAYSWRGTEKARITPILLLLTPTLLE